MPTSLSGTRDLILPVLLNVEGQYPGLHFMVETDFLYDHLVLKYVYSGIRGDIVPFVTRVHIDDNQVANAVSDGLDKVFRSLNLGPYEYKPVMEAGAQEYDEIFAGQDIMDQITKQSPQS